jgi:16S rRNA (cytosine967-C5)-methyltransferase
MPATDPRSICLLAIIEWENTRRFADDILHDKLKSGHLSLLDRAFANEAFYGILRKRLCLDWIIDRLRERELDLKTRCVLRLGLYQIFWMRVPDHAAVNETVSLAGRARDLANAVLRRAVREREKIGQSIECSAPHIRLSHPQFLFDRWVERFGMEQTVKLCEWNNTPPPVFVRANTLKITTGELERAATGAERCEFHPLALKVTQIPFIWIAGGLCYVQDPSTLTACDLLAPAPGERILDACAAPGGKTSYIAAMMKNSGELVACDSSSSRLERLRENLDRMGVTVVTTQLMDWMKPDNSIVYGNFDAILLDAPCTNSGVLRRRADARWRLTEADFPRMQERQLALLSSLVPYLREGGRIVYSTCSIEPEENTVLVKLAESRIPGLHCVECKESLPFRDAVDGAFAAKFVLQR